MSSEYSSIIALLVPMQKSIDAIRADMAIVTIRTTAIELEAVRHDERIIQLRKEFDGFDQRIRHRLSPEMKVVTDTVPVLHTPRWSDMSELITALPFFWHLLAVAGIVLTTVGGFLLRHFK